MDPKLQQLNDDVEEFIKVLELNYNDKLAIAAAITQHGLRYYKRELNPDEFAHLLLYTIETNRLL